MTWHDNLGNENGSHFISLSCTCTCILVTIFRISFVVLIIGPDVICFDITATWPWPMVNWTPHSCVSALHCVLFVFVFLYFELYAECKSTAWVLSRKELVQEPLCYTVLQIVQCGPHYTFFSSEHQIRCYLPQSEATDHLTVICHRTGGVSLMMGVGWVRSVHLISYFTDKLAVTGSHQQPTASRARPLSAFNLSHLWQITR